MEVEGPERQDRPSPDPAEDSRRVRAYLDGEPAVFAEVESWIRAAIEARYPVLRHDLDDLCQAIHQKLVASLRAGRFGRRSSLRTYVSGIVHHTAIDLIRERWREPRIEPVDDDVLKDEARNPYESLAALEESSLLRLALQAVPEACRALWRMVFVERLSYAEIGRRLVVPAGTVKSRMWHCRAKALAIVERLRVTQPFKVRRSRP